MGALEGATLPSPHTGPASPSWPEKAQRKPGGMLRPLGNALSTPTPSACPHQRGLKDVQTSGAPLKGKMSHCWLRPPGVSGEHQVLQLGYDIAYSPAPDTSASLSPGFMVSLKEADGGHVWLWSSQGDCQKKYSASTLYQEGFFCSDNCVGSSGRCVGKERLWYQTWISGNWR